MRNPFRPTFGVSPHVLAGRADMLAEFADSLDDGPGAPGRATVYTGGRGTGKTVMLNEVADIAASRGWLVVAETADHGFVTRLVTESLPRLLREHDPDATRTRITGASAGGFSIDTSTTDRHMVAAGLRGQLEALCTILQTRGTGLLITLDEVQRHDGNAIVDFFVAVQHLVRDEHDIAVVCAGLPGGLSDLLSDRVITFLRRADKHTLGAVGSGEVERTIRETVETGGRSIGAAACARAAAATDGYPFLIQLVGYHVWRQHPDAPEITLDDVDAGVPAALRKLGSQVHETALHDLSTVDRNYLMAMSIDDGPSRTADIAARLGVSAQYANVYRQRLIDALMIEPAGHGRVNYSLPYLREYLRGHGSLEAQLAIDAAPGAPGELAP